MSQYPHLYGDGRWKHPKRGLRAQKLQADPLCWYCQQMGRVVPADVVDHIVPHKGDDVLFWDENNLRSSCTPCHNTAADFKDRYGYVPGVGVDGLPVDPGHPWRKT
jgi:5-methylcytosine-specific restriction enzyme A